MECKKKENAEECPCTYISKRTHMSCARKGLCCECLKHHLASNELPACCFPPEIAKTDERSFEAFAKAWGL